MTYWEQIDRPDTHGERVVVRLLRRYRDIRDRDRDGGALARLVALGHRLRLPPAGSVALASVFELTEAVLGRHLVTGCHRTRDYRDYSADERAMLRLLSARLPGVAGTGTVEIPHGLPGALAWAVLSVRSLCGGMLSLPARPAASDDATCPFHGFAAA
ncbi:hypothetical protein QLH51_06605 [Sphingomonas sp. 2R-10]|uniref:hypothetical protein n=1 Tax=Sphingomonas sp. 2R-10 TaxID=3045148 RepID=UPI000F7AB5A7|nr:hypothetical protein [Sphingomonas sp. 2R-10]MDJ0276463.1 hypothetical protein [Sphingomonas sp. 2R-10]